MLAADIQVFCGVKRVGWGAFATVARELDRIGLEKLCYGFQNLEMHEDGVLSMVNMSIAHQGITQDGPLLPTYVVLIVARRLCSDPRDRVYGTLGLTHSSFQSRIHISYSNNSKEAILATFIEFSKACIEEKLTIILETLATRSGYPSLPSWCPNFQYTREPIDLFGEHLRAGSSGDTMSTETFRGKTSPVSNELTITGFRVGIVSEVVDFSCSWPGDTSRTQNIERARRFLD